ncbi:MAG: ATP-binding protein [Paracoccaceae bacterium]
MHSLAVREITANIGMQTAKSIQNEISKRIVTVQALVAFKNIEPAFSYDEFLSFANDIKNNDASILCLQLAPNGIVEYVTGVEHNAAVIGHNILEDPEHSEAAFDAIANNNFMFVGPVDLIQGGVGLIARKPIFEQEQFWGFATVVIDFAAVTSLFPQNAEEGMQPTRHQNLYALRELSETTPHRILWGDSEIFEMDPHLAEIELATGTWQLATIPSKGWPTAWPAAPKFRAASLIFATVISVFSVFLLRQPSQLRQAVSVATADLRMTEDNLREAHRVAKIGALTFCPNTMQIGLSTEARALLGVRPKMERLETEDFALLVHSEDRERVRGILKETIDNSNEAESIFRITKADGADVVIKLRAQERSDFYDDGQTLSATIQDVTEETRKEEQLRRAQKMEAIGKLTGGVAHDFNNLLAAIQGNSELLEATLDHDLDLLDEIQKATRRGASLTQRLLAYARKQPLVTKQTDLTLLIRDMERILSRTIGENIDVILKLPSDLWHVKVDPGQIEDAILNLALNARDAMSSGGMLRIECANTSIEEQDIGQAQELSEGSYVVISISDNGVGMDHLNLERAVEPFFTTKGVGQGSGLGLSMVSGLAQQSGGAMTIDSQTGLGTTVKIYLPQYANVEVLQFDLEPKIDFPKGNGETILIVEDNEVVLQMLKRMVKKLNYTVAKAQTVHEAHLLLAARSDIDLILTDVILPGGQSGLDLVASIEDRAWRPEIVIMSGNPSVDGGKNEDMIEQHSFLKKPFTQADLAEIVHRKLKHGNATKRNVTTLPPRRA